MERVFKELQGLVEKGEISLLEVEFGKFLMSRDTDISLECLIAAQSCVYDQLEGNICSPVSEILTHKIYSRFFPNSITANDLLHVLTRSSVVGAPGQVKPLILQNENLYLQKLWNCEQELCTWIVNKSKQKQTILQAKRETLIAQLNVLEKPDAQQTAVLVSQLKELLILTGGPGTGKTYTVQQIIATFLEDNPDLRIKLAAPTGKAAQRLNESLSPNLEELEMDLATTVHKLLGAKGVSGNFSFNSVQKLPVDVLVIDEASMLDIFLWVQLIRALPEKSVLILLGDKNQLSSVEAGSILGDICYGFTPEFSTLSDDLFQEVEVLETKNPLNNCIVELTKSYRFSESSGIHQLSLALKNEDEAKTNMLLASEAFEDVRFMDISQQTIDMVLTRYAIDPFFSMKELDFEFLESESFQILCALRKGPFGVETINELSEKRIKERLNLSGSSGWYQGRPIIATANNSLLNVRNGEIGRTLVNLESNLYEVYFESNPQFGIPVPRIKDYEPGYAITIHKSQGSEFDHVAILLSNTGNSLLSKELLYTAITRARKSVLIAGDRKILPSIIEKSIYRRSNISNKLWK